MVIHLTLDHGDPNGEYMFTLCAFTRINLQLNGTHCNQHLLPSVAILQYLYVIYKKSRQYCLIEVLTFLRVYFGIRHIIMRLVLLGLRDAELYLRDGGLLEHKAGLGVVDHVELAVQDEVVVLAGEVVQDVRVVGPAEVQVHGDDAGKGGGGGEEARHGNHEVLLEVVEVGLCNYSEIRSLLSTQIPHSAPWFEISIRIHHYTFLLLPQLLLPLSLLFALIFRVFRNRLIQQVRVLIVEAILIRMVYRAVLVRARIIYGMPDDVSSRSQRQAESLIMTQLRVLLSVSIKRPRRILMRFPSLRQLGCHPQLI